MKFSLKRCKCIICAPILVLFMILVFVSGYLFGFGKGRNYTKAEISTALGFARKYLNNYSADTVEAHKSIVDLFDLMLLTATHNLDFDYKNNKRDKIFNYLSAATTSSIGVNANLSSYLLQTYDEVDKYNLKHDSEFKKYLSDEKFRKFLKENVHDYTKD